MKNIKLTIAYDGVTFYGWQKGNHLSIEESLEKALKTLLQENISLQAASRTDSKVHAKGQIVNFLTSQKSLDLKKLLRGLNGLLPKEISILKIEEKELSFHPTLDALSKEYHYFIQNSTVQPPHTRNYSWHYPYKKLDIKQMQKGSASFIGKKDFSSFCNKNVSNGEREIQSLEVSHLTDELICIKIIGKSFLYNMVRIIVGTLVMVGNYKLSLDDLENIFKQKKRSLAGPTAPAHGLFLMKVFYEDE